MSTVTESRKEREIREREQRILALARDHLMASGYLGLNIERIAAEMEYSKGTIYQHFRNKEEILLALANESLQVRTAMFSKAADRPGTSRQRIAAVGAAAEAFVEAAPHYFLVDQIIRASSIWEKTSPERQELMRMCEQRCVSIIGGVVHDAISDADLMLPPEYVPADIVFGLWSINWGAQSIWSSSDSLGEIGIPSPIASLRKNQNRMLDGYGWRALSTEFDYSAHMDRIKLELFADVLTN